MEVDTSWFETPRENSAGWYNTPGQAQCAVKCMVVTQELKLCRKLSDGRENHILFKISNTWFADLIYMECVTN